jgi:hypothetical protein
MKVIRILVLAALVVSLAAAPLYADDEVFGQAQVYKYPKLKPEYGVWGGFYLTDSNGSRRAGEFVYFKDSPSVGGKVIAFPFPHRLHLELDFLNGKDYFGDFRYAYKDTVLFRSVNRGLFHNQGNIELVNDGNGIVRADVGEIYGYSVFIGDYSVRFKMPHFPAHAFIKGHYDAKDGNRQQRRIGGGAYFGVWPRVSEKRDVDWKTTEIMAGLNSHLGPVEAQYEHTELRFKADNGIDSAAYLAGSTRLAGTYPHSVVPKLEDSTDAIKVHTTYTGRLVASATFMAGEDENKTSGANADRYLMAGEVVWTPVAKFSGALRYRHEERDVDNPDSLPAGYLGFADFTAINNIRNSISTDTSTLTAIARYRPTKKITVGADIIFRHWDRDHAEEWGIEDSTDETTLGLSVNWRALKSLKLKGKYRYKGFDDPAYNNQPDDSHRMDIAATWTPVARVVLFASYSLTMEDREHLHTLVEGVAADVRDREVDRDTFTASVSYMPLDNLSFTWSFGYWVNEITQDMAYGNSAGAPPANPPFIDRGVEYEDTTRNYTLSADYSPLEQLDLHAGINYTKSCAGFDPNNAVALNPINVAWLSRLEIKETSYEFRAKYEVIKDLDLGFEFEYRKFDDILENPDNPDIQDGSAQIYMVTVNKRW